MKNNLFFSNLLKVVPVQNQRVAPFLRSSGADFKLLMMLFILQILALLFDQNSCLFLSLYIALFSLSPSHPVPPENGAGGWDSRSSIACKSSRK